MSAFYMDDRPVSIATRAIRALVACLAAAALAVLMTWPLAADLEHLGRTQNSGDARFAVWNVAWVAHALTTNPAELYDANIFYPHRRTLAYSEANIAAGALAVPAWWFTRNANTSHNIVVLFSFAASLVCTWLLVRRLTGDGGAAAVAAMLYAFCPYLFSHTAHIQLLMAAGLPLVLLAFHKLVDAPSSGRGIALGLALTIAALACAYYGIFAALAVGYAVFFYAWSRGLWRSAAYWRAVAIGALVSVGLVLPFFLPYLEIQEETGFGRSLDDARPYAAIWKSYLASGAWPHRWMLPYLGNWNQEVLFPGFVSLVLGLTGFFISIRSTERPPEAQASPPRARETAIFYGSLAMVVFWASLGPAAGLYTVLYKTIPVFSLLRAPGRMGILVMLSLAIFAALAVRAIRQRLAPRPAATIAAVSCAAALIDLRQFPFDWRRDQQPPSSYKVLAEMPRGAVAEFPFFDRRVDFHIHTRYMLNSTTHWQPLLNGYSDHIPADFRTLATRLASFPSRDSFQAMRERRVRYLVVHRDRYGRAAPDLDRRLDEFRPFLRVIAQDERIDIYEVTGWPN